MKSVLIIGMGRFGHHLCQKLIDLDNEVMIVDINENAMSDMLPYVTGARIGDCTNLEVLKSIGVGNFDVCFVCIGTNFQSSLEITALLKENGATCVVSKATRDIQAKFLLRNGADEVVYPNRDSAVKVATRYSADHVFDYIQMNDQYAIYEISVRDEWVGKTIMELNFRKKYNVNILGSKLGEETNLMLSADHVFEKEEHLMVIGKKEDIEKMI